VGKVLLAGERRIEIGDMVVIGSGCWLQTLADQDNRCPAISIGSHTTIEGAGVISAVRAVTIEDSVLIARNVYISDHSHEYRDTAIPIRDQGLAGIMPVRVGRGAWIGQNVVICPGVTIGRGAVIGANSVVKKDVPDFCVAVGSPARVVPANPK